MTVTAAAAAYADRIVAGLGHYAHHTGGVIVCGGECDVPLGLRTNDEIHTAQLALLMLAWDAKRGNPLRLTRRQHDALMHLNDRLADFVRGKRPARVEAA